MNKKHLHQFLFAGLFWLSATGLFAQSTVSGIITEPDGLPAIGASIMIKGTSTGTTSNLDGHYSLPVISIKDTLVVSYVGYKEEIIPINGRNQIDIQLVLDAQVLEDVVVVGYGIQKKSDVTGAVAHIDAEDINKIPTANVEQALQGRVTGVQVSAPSGEPGSSPVIRIRGVGTFGDARPIYVVDGVIMESIDHLSSMDIESIDVLKDASATAIYGSRGANGVIIVSTKKGSFGKKTTFQFGTYYGSQQVAKKIKLANGTEFATLANEVAVNENTTPLYSDVEQYGAGFDWQDYIFQVAPIFNTNLSASGGSDKMIYNLSGNYYEQEGIIKQSDFRRMTFRMNNEYLLTDHVRFGHNLSFTNTKSVQAPGVLLNAYRVYPIFEPRDSTGNFWDTSPVGNPAAQFEYNNNFAKANQLNGNVYVQIDFLKNFSFKSSLGLNKTYGESKTFVPEFYVSPNIQNEENSISVEFRKNNNYVYDNLLTYSQDFGDHDLTVLGGIVAQTNESEWLGGSRRNVLGESEEFYYLDAGPADYQINYNNADDWSIFSYLFRTQYSYKRKYLATASYRIDGSSKFGKNNRYAQFPSFSLGWVASHEPFLSQSDIISRLKFRAGWGITGNEKITSYPSSANVTGGLDAIFGVNETLNYGYSPIDLSNDDLKWEESKQLNIGMEVAFLDNRLSGELDFFRKVTSGILLQPNIPDFVGAGSPPFQNAADILNRGIEGRLDWRQAGKFSYNAGVMFTTIHNEVLSLGQGRDFLEGGDLGVGGKRITYTSPGHPIGAFYGFETDGIFQNQADIDQAATVGDEQPGDLRFVDQNGDGMITSSDDRVYLGSSIPTLIYGFNLGAAYAGIDLGIDFTGQSGNKVANAKKIARFGTYNFESSFLDRWTEDAPSTTEPRVTNGGHNYLVSDRMLEDGSFLKLRSIQLGYTLPTKLTQKWAIHSLRFYVSGTDLWILSDYSGYSPEIASEQPLENGVDRGIFPPTKTIIFGLNTQF